MEQIRGSYANNFSKSCFFGCPLSGPLHRFPSPVGPFKVKFDRWKAALGDNEWTARGNVFLHRNIKLCGRHFVNKFKLANNRLTPNCYPTKHLTHATNENTSLSNKNTISAEHNKNDQTTKTDLNKPAEIPDDDSNKIKDHTDLLKHIVIVIAKDKPPVAQTAITASTSNTAPTRVVASTAINPIAAPRGIDATNKITVKSEFGAPTSIPRPNTIIAPTAMSALTVTAIQQQNLSSIQQQKYSEKALKLLKCKAFLKHIEKIEASRKRGSTAYFF